MIEHLLEGLVCERFRNDTRYREGHLRVVNALPARRVLGVHVPEMKVLAKQLSAGGCEVVMSDGVRKQCNNGRDVIRCFESVESKGLCYEETIIWGLLINYEKCSIAERFSMLEHYVPIMDNWAVCDTYCAHAKWMLHTDKEVVWNFLQSWFSSKREFEVRFAIVMSMCYFLHEDWLNRVFQRIEFLDFNLIESEYSFLRGKPKAVQQGTVQGEKPYYVRMGVAWLLATALAKYPQETRSFVRSSQIPDEVIRLYIRKSRESFRTRTVKAI